MTLVSKRQIAEIEGRLYLISRMPREKWSNELSGIMSSVKKMLREFERSRKQHLLPVRRCLTLLVGLLENSHVTIETVEDREVWNWTIKEAKRILDTWDEI